jgi:hypothetical protein
MTRLTRNTHNSTVSGLWILQSNPSGRDTICWNIFAARPNTPLTGFTSPKNNMAMRDPSQTLSKRSMGGLSHCHPLVSFRRRDPNPLAPQQQGNWKQQDREADGGCDDTDVLYTQIVGPRCEREQNDDGEQVADKDNAYHDVSKDLKVVLVEPLHQGVAALATYLLIAICHVGKGDATS